MDGRVPEVVHRVVVAAVVLECLRVVPDEVRGLLDLAERLQPVLADLEGHVRAVAHLPLGDELGGFAHDRQAVLPRRMTPRGRGGAGGGNRPLRIGAIALGERPDDACHGRSASGPRRSRRTRPPICRRCSSGDAHRARRGTPRRPPRRARAALRCRCGAWRT